MCGVRGLTKKMDSDTRVQILDVAIWISQDANIFEKGMNQLFPF